MVANKVAKVTISLPQHLLDIADRLAEENATSRSSIIAHLLQKEERARVEALMIEGYKAMAEENRKLAQEVFPLVVENLRKNTSWDEPPNG
jgi:metal-responsive CopG/Arc/MetJ family transcriptional regulator